MAAHVELPQAGGYDQSADLVFIVVGADDAARSEERAAFFAHASSSLLRMLREWEGSGVKV